MSVSVGAPGATLNLSSRGTALTLGIPGTGLSYRTSLSTGAGRSPAVPPPEPLTFTPAAPSWQSFQKGDVLPSSGEICSAEVASLTSRDLLGLKKLINEAAAQRRELEPELRTAIQRRHRAWRKLRRAEQLPLRLLSKDRIPRLHRQFEADEREAKDLALAVAGSKIRVTFNFDESSLRAYCDLEAKYERVAQATSLWDVTASVWVDRVKERSAASNAVSRTPVRFSRSVSDVVTGDYRSLALQNANGGDLELFPGFCLIREKASKEYALVDVRELHLAFKAQRFIEEERLPHDAKVVGSAWAKSNKDGSPDRRFNGNYQIPIALYGELRLTSATGVAEAYHVSDCMAAAEFADSYNNFQRSLRAMAANSTQGDLSDADQDLDELPKEAEKLLPPLPKIGPAHDLTLLAAAMILAAPSALWWSTQSSQPASTTPVSITAPSAPAARAVPAGEFGTSSGLPSRTPSPQARDAHPVAPLKQTAPVGNPKITASPEQRTTAPPQASPPRVESLQRLFTSKRANVRVAADAKSPKVATIPAGTPILALSRSGAWIEAADAANHRLGWISRDLLVDSLPDKDAAVKQEPSPTKIKPPAVRVTPTISQAAIIARLIQESRASYPGSCACPDDYDRGGRRCGGRSAYSRKGGYGPLCYPRDVSPSMVAAERQQIATE